MSRSIFREEALRRYSEPRVERVLPQLVSPRVFRALWILAALPVVGLVICASARMPLYASAPAIVVPGKGSARALAFFPPRLLGKLPTNRPMWVGAKPEKATVLYVDALVSDPAAVKERFGPGAGAVAEAAGPSVIVVAAWNGPAATVGSVCRAEIQIGTEPLFLMLPGIRARLGD